jgi:hypothetical protein
VLGQGLQLGGLLLDLADQPGHARHHQQEQRDRADPDGGRVDPAAPPRLAEQQDRRDQRDPGQQRQPPACEPPRPLQGRLGQLRHRRVQRRRPEQHIGQQPGEVDGVVGSERIGLASTAKPTSPASMTTREPARSWKAVFRTPAPTSSRATRASSSTSAAG